LKIVKNDPVPSPSTSKPGRSQLPSWFFGSVLLIAVAAVYALTAGRNVSLDVWTANFSSWRIAIGNGPHIDGVTVPGIADNGLRPVWVIENSDGHQAIGRAPGVVAAAIPAYWLAQPAAMTALPGAITAAFLTAASLWLLFGALEPRLGRRQALLATLLFGFTTPVWTVAADGMWPHTLTVLGICGMAWAAQRERWWLVGLFGGIALWGRLHAALICALLGVLLAVRRRRPSIAISAGLNSGALLALMGWWTHWMFGTWDPTSAYSASQFTDYASRKGIDVVNHLGFWVSPDRGMLIWTPLLILLVPALVKGWRDVPDWSRDLLLGGVVYTLLQLTLNRFSGGDTFYGYRIGLELLACAAPALAFAAPNMGGLSRKLFTPVAALQFAMILPGALLDSFHVPSDEVWTDNAFYEVLKTNPRIFPLLMLLIFAWAWLVARIWANPGLEKGARPRLSGADREPTGRNLPSPRTRAVAASPHPVGCHEAPRPRRRAARPPTRPPRR
jgi:hypothetical protein